MAKSIEEKVEEHYKDCLKELGITYYGKTQASQLNESIANALKEAPSKSGGSGNNYPDIMLMLKSRKLNRYIPVMIEAKGGKNKLEKLDKEGNIEQVKLWDSDSKEGAKNPHKKGDPNFNSIEKYAVNGAYHYAKIILVDEQLRFEEFKLASSYFKNGKEVKVSTDGIFNITPTKKKINANTISFGGRYPYVARGESQNGIRGYINFDENYLNPEKTISFGQDTATMFYQPKAYFTGDKIQVFSLNSKHGELNEKIATYLITAVRKALVNFAWGQSSFALEVISELNVMLPVDKYDRLNLNYMENYIRAIEKLTIKDVVEYKDKMIEIKKKIFE